MTRKRYSPILLVCMILALSLLGALMGMSISRNQPPEVPYNTYCINEITYIKPKSGHGSYTVLVDQNNKPVSCKQ